MESLSKKTSFLQTTRQHIRCQMTDSLAPAPADDDDDPFDFVPVRTAARRDGWTPARQRAFIAELATHGSVAAAARAVGMTPQTANRLRRRPGAEGFARAWTVAREEGRLKMYEQAVVEARDGRLVPVTYAGRVIGHRRVFDSRLLFAACYGVSLEASLR
jgi:hypothetical protein